MLSKDALLDYELNEAYHKQFASFDEYMARGSGWTLKQVLNMEVHTLQYHPIGASSYIDMPKTLKDAHAIINIQNSDQKCFLWSVLARLHPRISNAQRVSNYLEYEDELDMDGISYPVRLKDIPKFESK